MRIREVAAVLSTALVLAACGGGTGENENRLGVSTTAVNGPVPANSTVVVTGRATNKDSYIRRMHWTVSSASFDNRTGIAFLNGGECVFDVPGGTGRTFGVEDEKQCAAELRIGPMPENGTVTLRLTAEETGGLTRSAQMTVQVLAGSGRLNLLVVDAGLNRTATPNSVVFVQGRATNRDSLIKLMKWTIASASHDRRTLIQIRGGGECDFDVDDDATGDDFFGVVDERVCSAAVEIGPLPADEDIILSLTAVEAGGMSRSDEMRLAVRSDARALVADAGPDRVLPAPANVQQSCRYSGGFFFDMANPAPRYTWRLANAAELMELGVSVTFNYNDREGLLTLAIPTVPNDTPVVMECTVEDDVHTAATDTVTFLMRNAASLAADAGPDQRVRPGDLVVLRGTVHDPENRGVPHVRWVQVAGPEVNLITPNQTTASFVAPDLPVSTKLVFEFQTSRTAIGPNTIFAESERDRVFVEVEVPEQVLPRLIANAGPVQIVQPGAVVQMAGSVIDPANIGGPYYYQWQQLAGPPVLLLGGNLPNPSFVAPNVESSQELVFELRVSRAPISGDTLFAASEVSTTMVHVQP